MTVNSLEGRIDILLCRFWCLTRTCTDRDGRQEEDVVLGEAMIDKTGNWAAMVKDGVMAGVAGGRAW